MAQPHLSVAIVCKNAERTLRRTLESVRGLASEIIALDSGSTDATLDILEEFQATVHHVQWRGFAQTKNDAMERCSGAWVLHLDADESLTPELRASVERAMREDDPSIVAYELNRKVWWGRMLHHVWQPEWRLRLTRRGAAKWGGYEPHPSLELIDGASNEPGAQATGFQSATPASPQTGTPSLALRARGGRIARLQGDLRHDAFETMEEFLAKQVVYSRQGAESYLRMGRRASVFSLVFSPLGAWLKQVVIKQAWRDGWRGMACATAVAMAAAMKHSILLDLQRGRHQGTEASRHPVSDTPRDAAHSEQDIASHV